ncbi:hypothetical protein KFU94_41580 [Chloroflexi bacterium TSY]|nr:hypothetical protein [Chloroflexi bacterium TSY]
MQVKSYNRVVSSDPLQQSIPSESVSPFASTELPQDIVRPELVSEDIQHLIESNGFDAYVRLAHPTPDKSNKFFRWIAELAIKVTAVTFVGWPFAIALIGMDIIVFGKRNLFQFGLSALGASTVESVLTDVVIGSTNDLLIQGEYDVLAIPTSQEVAYSDPTELCGLMRGELNGVDTEPYTYEPMAENEMPLLDEFANNFISGIATDSVENVVNSVQSTKHNSRQADEKEKWTAAQRHMTQGMR